MLFYRFFVGVDLTFIVCEFLYTTDIIESHGAEYTNSSFEYKKILRVIETPDGHKLVKLKWKDSWIDESALDDDEPLEDWVIMHANKVPKAKKIRRGTRGRGKKVPHKTPSMINVMFPPPPYPPPPPPPPSVAENA